MEWCGATVGIRRSHSQSLHRGGTVRYGVGRGFEFGDGSVRRVGTWEGRLAAHDLVLADCVGWGRQQDLLRASGVPHLGFNATLDRVEVDRAKGMELFATAGITIPETVEFGSKAEAIALPAEQGWGDGWVIKPSGNLANDTTRTVKEPGLWERACQPLSDHCNGIAQRLVSGIEVSTEGWFNGTRFLQPFNHTSEEKRFLAGGLGCNTGCMGNVVLQAKTGGNRLTRATVEPLAQFLALIGYRGPFDVNAIVTEDEHMRLRPRAAWALTPLRHCLRRLRSQRGSSSCGLRAVTTEDYLSAMKLLSRCDLRSLPTLFVTPTAVWLVNPSSGLLTATFRTFPL